MSEGSSVICRCNVCNGKLEFDQTQVGGQVTCPHCGMETQLYVPNAPIPPDPPPPVFPIAQEVPPVLPRSEIKQAEQPRSPAPNSLKGTILEFVVQTNTGIISGDNGHRYSFNGSEWKAVGKFPSAGMRVDFLPSGETALVIYEGGGSTKGDRGCNRVVAGLLAIFLGWLGIHKFYMGYSNQGVILLACGTVGWLIVLPAAGAALFGLIEGITYLSLTEEQFQQNYIKGRKPWL